MPDPSPSTDQTTPRGERMRVALQQALNPCVLQIEDDSARHAGHAGAAPGGQTHYTVRITAEAFAGLSRVARSRKVHEALAAEFASGLHALALILKLPGEKLSNLHDSASQTRHPGAEISA